jgi:hypothetical protein
VELDRGHEHDSRLLADRRALRDGERARELHGAVKAPSRVRHWFSAHWRPLALTAGALYVAGVSVDVQWQEAQPLRCASGLVAVVRPTPGPTHNLFQVYAPGQTATPAASTPVPAAPDAKDFACADPALAYRIAQPLRAARAMHQVTLRLETLGVQLFTVGDVYGLEGFTVDR